MTTEVQEKPSSIDGNNALFKEVDEKGTVSWIPDPPSRVAPSVGDDPAPDGEILILGRDFNARTGQGYIRLIGSSLHEVAFYHPDTYHYKDDIKVIVNPAFTTAVIEFSEVE